MIERFKNICDELENWNKQRELPAPHPTITMTIEDLRKFIAVAEAARDVADMWKPEGENWLKLRETLEALDD